MKIQTYFILILVGIPFFTLSCAGATPAVESTPQPTPSPPPQTNDRPLFPTFGWKTDFSKHSVPYSEIISGGVGRDGKQLARHVAEMINQRRITYITMTMARG